MKQFGLRETNLFNFHKLFKNGGAERRFKPVPLTPSGSTTV